MFKGPVSQNVPIPLPIIKVIVKQLPTLWLDILRVNKHVANTKFLANLSKVQTLLNLSLYIYTNQKTYFRLNFIGDNISIKE